MNKKNFPTRFLSVCLLALSGLTVCADDEDAPIATLRSEASLSQKWAACQKLRVVGTARSVPALAALLTDQQLSQAARYVLEVLPSPEADDALREALQRTSGPLKAGIADSIGWRGKAAPFLIPVLSDSDSTVAAAAAVSLGRVGGQDAIAALSNAAGQSSSVVQAAAQASLLQCAERLATNNDETGAAAIYHRLYNEKYPMSTRTAAWRGLVLTDKAHQTELIAKALSGADRQVELVALKVLRESGSHALVQACVSQWDQFPPESQLAVLDAAVKEGGEALPLVQKANRSPNVAVRVAALADMGEVNDLTAIPTLARACMEGAPAERQAAKESLARLRGPGAFEALLKELNRSAAPEKAVLLQLLGMRADGQAADVLLQDAAAGDESVRLAALRALKEIAPPEALSTLLQITEKADSDNVRDRAVEVLEAVCQASPDKTSAARTVIEAESKMPPAQRAAVLPLLADLGTADALTAAQAASRSQDLDLAKAAVKAISQWPNATPAVSLLDLARSATDNTLRTLALRGAITANGQEPDAAKRLAFLKEAMAAAKRPDEKRQALGQLGQIPTPEALGVALGSMDDPAVSTEASLAVVSIAEKVCQSDPKLARQAAIKVLQQNKEGDIYKRALAVRLKSLTGVPFIRDWQVCGPYRKPGVVGATAIFNIPFGPEANDASVEWKDAPSADHINLAGMFPSAQNCAAYLRTTVVVPESSPGVLLMGSDDGIKAWLNGEVVHSNNVDRGEKEDQDAAPITLKKGSNELLLKISQGDGGWGACARIVGADGNPINGLRVERPGAGLR